MIIILLYLFLRIDIQHIILLLYNHATIIYITQVKVYKYNKYIYI